MLLLILAAGLTGCATTYTDATNPLTGFAGGYYDQAGPGKLTTVGFYGNGFTDNERVRQFVLRRAAEVTKEQGKAHFLAFTSLDTAAAMQPVGEDLGIHSLGGKPFQDIYILTLAEPQTGSIDAAAVLARFVPTEETR